MSKKIHFGVSSAWLVGECKKCKEPTTGEINTDDSFLFMTCVNCAEEYQYKIKEKDRNYDYFIIGEKVKNEV